MQRAVKRSHLREGDRALVRHMGLGKHLSQQRIGRIPVRAFIPACIARHARLVPAGVGPLLPPEELSMSIK